MTAPLDETGAVVARVRDALDGVPDSTTLYARGMKLTGWRHEVTAGEVRTLLAAVDTRTRERDEARDLLDLAQQEAPRVLADALAPIEAQRDALRQRFRDYGEHTETCDSWSGFSTDPSGCSCGFTASWYATFPEDKT